MGKLIAFRPHTDDGQDWACGRCDNDTFVLQSDGYVACSDCGSLLLDPDDGEVFHSLRPR